MNILIMGEKTYQVWKSVIESTLNLAKQAMNGRNSIYAIQKNEITEMKKEIFESEPDLIKRISEYEQRGFFVSYTKTGSKN